MATRKLEFEAEMAEADIRGERIWIILNLKGRRAVLSEVFGSGTYIILLIAGQNKDRRLAEYLEKGFKSEMALVEVFIGFKRRQAGERLWPKMLQAKV